MLRRRLSARREGGVLPLVAVSLVALMTLLALAIDLGMIAIARSQAQNAADASATAGARAINGDSAVNFNVDNAPINAVAAAVANRILGKPISGSVSSIAQDSAAPYRYKSGDVTVEIGAYAFYYSDDAGQSSSTEGFKIEVPRLSSAEPYSLVRSTVVGGGDYAFAKALGLSSFNVKAVASAAHRPRDVMIIVDLSGSMRFQSLAGVPVVSGYAQASSARARTTSLNPDPIFPMFGHYVNTTGAALQYTGSGIPTSSSEFVDPANITVETTSGPPIVNDFYKNAINTTPVVPADYAFSAAPDSYATAPKGDLPLRQSLDTSTTYARTVAEFNNSSTATNMNFEINGYKSVRSEFKGYTVGPRYYGKTFFIWPPNPPGDSVLAPPSSTSDNTFPWHDNGSKDWRQRFFVAVNTSTGKPTWLSHNSILFNTTDSSGSATTPALNNPGTAVTVTENGVNVSYTYRPNYAAILYWLRGEENPFPPTLFAGRIRYYKSIPDPTVTKDINSRWWSYNLSSLPEDERFWKNYIDFTLGYYTTGSTISNKLSSYPVSSMIGPGDFYKWSGSTFKISARPQPQPPATNPGGPYATIKTSASSSSGSTKLTFASVSPTPVANRDFVIINGDNANPYLITAFSSTSVTVSPALKAAVASGVNVAFRSPYMDYSDRPLCPKHQYWFGPMTMVDWLGNYQYRTDYANPHHWWPGNCHEAQSWPCKIGVQASIEDIRLNHPSDFVGLTFFSSPQTSASSSGQHNLAAAPLGRNYQQLKDALWYPSATVTGTDKEISPYSSKMTNTPRANGGTAPGMGFMIAYNQLSSSANSLRTYDSVRGRAGGLGRKGASRLVIFETDGSPNTRASASFISSGGDSYYKIRLKDGSDPDNSINVEWPSGGTFATSEVVDVAKRICAYTTDANPGYSTLRKPVEIHCLGYGSLFEPANAGTNQTTALTFFSDVENASLTNIKGATLYSGASAFPDSKLIYGSTDTRISRMQAAFSKIMQGDVQVSLLE